MLLKNALLTADFKRKKCKISNLLELIFVQVKQTKSGKILKSFLQTSSHFVVELLFLSQDEVAVSSHSETSVEYTIYS